MQMLLALFKEKMLLFHLIYANYPSSVFLCFFVMDIHATHTNKGETRGCGPPSLKPRRRLPTFSGLGAVSLAELREATEQGSFLSAAAS